MTCPGIWTGWVDGGEFGGSVFIARTPSITETATTQRTIVMIF